MISRHWIVAIALLMLTGCAVGPNYKRPPVTVPGGYRGLAPDSGQQTIASIGDEKWWTVFQDEQLQALIREALSPRFEAGVAVISGPTFAREVAAGEPTALVVASSRAEDAQRIQNAFSGFSSTAFSRSAIVCLRSRDSSSFLNFFVKMA